MLFAMNAMLVLFLLIELLRLRLSQNVSFLRAVGIYFNQFIVCLFIGLQHLNCMDASLSHTLTSSLAAHSPSKSCTISAMGI